MFTRVSQARHASCIYVCPMFCLLFRLLVISCCGLYRKQRESLETLIFQQCISWHYSYSSKLDLIDQVGIQVISGCLLSYVRYMLAWHTDQNWYHIHVPTVSFYYENLRTYILLYVPCVYASACTLLTCSTLSLCSYPPAWPTEDIPTIRETVASLIKYVCHSSFSLFRNSLGDFIWGNDPYFIFHVKNAPNFTVTIYLRIKNIWQSWVEIKHCFVAYFNYCVRNASSSELLLRADPAHTGCVNVVSIHAFT